MPTIRISDVPEETLHVLRRRAAGAQVSLDKYLLALLVEYAREPNLNDAFDRIDERRGGRALLDTTTSMLRDERDRH